METFCKTELLSGLPKPLGESLHSRIRSQVVVRPGQKLVVLDDDPTGTQTVHDLPVLTVWDVETLTRELMEPEPCFFILTNSRSFPASRAADINREIARNLIVAAQGVVEARKTDGKGGASEPPTWSLISRSDSTLRGHFPLETDVLNEELGPFDATLLIPYFEAGGRYTIGDVHYVADRDGLVPAAETAFARDAVFGFHASNLREWVQEKTGGRIPAEGITSITLEDIRTSSNGVPSFEAITQKLLSIPRGGVGIVNAAHPTDLERFVLGLLEAEKQGRRYLFRTAAQFVSARLGLPPRSLLPAGIQDMGATTGGLTIVGSHVPKTTEQLQVLWASSSVERCEVPVDALLDEGKCSQVLQETLDLTENVLGAGRDMVVYTSRDLVRAQDSAGNLEVGRRVSEALVDLVRRLQVRPRYLLAKGGITSSDLATAGLGVQRAWIEGQLLPGVPVWRIGEETRFPGLTYVVFPGNVGGGDALSLAIQKLSK